MVGLSLQLEISGLERVRRATPSTALYLTCLLSGRGEGGEQLVWSEKRPGGEEEDRLVSRVRLDNSSTITHIPGFTSLLLTENREDSWSYSWRLIIENVSPQNSAVYQCKVMET